MTPLRDRLREMFGLDLRSLGVLRIGLGAILLWDLGRRTLELRAQYTDFGILPRELLRGYAPPSWYTPYTLVSGSEAGVAALFAVAALAAVAVLVGWRTRAAVVVSWVLLSSIQWRNPTLNNGGDVMLRMFLFWGAFLPLGARFSWDVRRRPAAPGPQNPVVSAASVALLAQLAMVYWFAVANRTGPTWWDGSALWYALQFDLFAQPLALRVRDLVPILPPLTIAALLLEIVGPFALFSPFWTAPLRVFGAACFATLHLSIWALFYLGHFQAIFILGWIAVLPAWFWDRLLAPVWDTRPGEAGFAAAGSSPPSRWRPAREAVVALLLAYAVFSNVNTVGLPLGEMHFDPKWTQPAVWLRLDQRWGLFAPNPPVNDGWYVATGRLASGAEVNLLDPARPAGFEKPVPVSTSLPLHLRYFFLALELEPRDPRWAGYGAYLCRAWNEDHGGDDRLLDLRLYFVRETTRLPRPERGEIVTLLSHPCP